MVSGFLRFFCVRQSHLSLSSKGIRDTHSVSYGAQTGSAASSSHTEPQHPVHIQSCRVRKIKEEGKKRGEKLERQGQ